jgi:hypothetical protein
MACRHTRGGEYGKSGRMPLRAIEGDRNGRARQCLFVSLQGLPAAKRKCRPMGHALGEEPGSAAGPDEGILPYSRQRIRDQVLFLPKLRQHHLCGSRPNSRILRSARWLLRWPQLTRTDHIGLGGVDAPLARCGFRIRTSPARPATLKRSGEARTLATRQGRQRRDAAKPGHWKPHRCLRPVVSPPGGSTTSTYPRSLR